MAFFLSPKVLLISAVLIGVGIFAGVLGERYTHESCNGFKYINHEFACGDRPVIKKGGYLALKNDVMNFIAARREAGTITEAAMYFRDLEGGPTTGIHEANGFAPASLLKLPLALAYFDYEEETPGVLKQKILYSRDNVKFLKVFEQVFISEVPLQEGNEYTIEELIHAMLAQSDNLSYYLLVEYFNIHVPDGSTRLLQIFQGLGIVDPRNPDEEVVSVRGYSGVFRQLYNPSFLSTEHSNLVLSWLVESSFDQALEAGVPADVEVAHKFGERIIEGGDKQLHDCGIVYFPDNPYFLCVMVKGGEWNEMMEVIQTISAMTYEEVNSRRL